MRADLPSRLVIPRPGYSGVRGFLGVHPALAAAGVGMLFVPVATSAYWTFQVMVGLVLAISCLGMLVLVGWAREISLMQAGLTGAATYICQVAYTPHGVGLGLPFPLAAACAVGFATLVSLVTSLVSVRLAGVYVAVSTLGVQVAIENSVFLDHRVDCFRDETPRPNFFGSEMLPDVRFYYFVLAVLKVVRTCTSQRIELVFIIRS